jgi:hypothetical protein
MEMEDQRGEIPVSDLPGTMLTEVERLVDKFFGDHVRQNDGTHLNDGVADDANW